ncbi:ribosomal protein L22 [Rickenella mellea]|uniref:Ribosomal protein L22 n=1 Tax=Rickenella mellea TaxID=50990 RepID=A0A4R5XFG0_9AGAM|nr:ribosomal protein L22 [Rickenella mellea]
MQVSSRGLRASAWTYSHLSLAHPHRIASTSRVQWESRRSVWKPMNWFRKNVGGQVREDSKKEEIESAKQELKAAGKASVFETLEEPFLKKEEKPKAHFHKISTANRPLNVSHRKLGNLARLIARKPIDAAILQMRFSQKRVAKNVHELLIKGRDQATSKGLSRDKIIISEAWVNKKMAPFPKVDFRAKGRFGKIEKSIANIHVVLKEGETLEEIERVRREKKLRKIVSAGMVREDKPLRNPAPTWAW